MIHITKFKPQSSKVKKFKPQSSKVKKFKPQSSKVKKFKPQSSKDKGLKSFVPYWIIILHLQLEELFLKILCELLRTWFTIDIMHLVRVFL